MVSNGTHSMQTLTQDEKHRIDEMVFDEFGDGLAFSEFAAVVHGFFEDIPGIETMGADEANDLINAMWSDYHDQAQH